MWPDLIFRKTLCLLGSALLIALKLSGAAMAQTANDLTALRYYVQQGDQASIQAELQRLRAAFPSWQPPQDLSQLGVTATPGADVDRIYQLIASGDVSGAQTALDTARRQDPGWTPPPDLLALLATTSAQQQFDTTVASDPARADQIARGAPALTRCDRINNVWRLAEAQTRAGQVAQARGAYQSIVASCPRYSDIVATLEKADTVTTLDQLAALFTTAMGRFPSNAAELATLQGQLRAGRAGPRTADGQTSTRAPVVSNTATPHPEPVPKAQPTVNAPQRSARQATTSRAPGGAIQVPASQWDGLPVNGDGRLRAMRQAASAGDWARCIAMTPNPRSLDLLNERGWCSLNIKRPLDALASFAAVAKGRVPSDMARDSRYGMAMTYLAMKMSNEAAKISAATNFTPSQRIEVEHEVLVQRALATYDRKDYRGAISYLNAAEMLRPLNRGLGVLRGYAYLNAGQRREALKRFTVLHNQMAGDDTRAGMDAAYQD